MLGMWVGAASLDYRRLIDGFHAVGANFLRDNVFLHAEEVLRRGGVVERVECHPCIESGAHARWESIVVELREFRDVLVGSKEEYDQLMAAKEESVIIEE